MKREMNNREERYLYLECSSGISGDMTVGALLDLGASREVLTKTLDSLEIGGYHLHFERTKKNGIDASRFDVHLEEEEHSHGHAHEHGHEHEHSHDHVHDRDHGDDHAHTHSHVHRNLGDVLTILDRLEEEEVKSLAVKMFRIVAEAESKAHGVPIEEVHFHEVGAIDSIVDIVSVAACIHDLGISRVIVSPLSEGSGYVRCQHGMIPVPVPATVNIAARYGLKLKRTENEGEMVTPTGAAIAAALWTEEKLPEEYTIEKIGLGAGKKDFSRPNVLRAMILRTEKNGEALEQPDSAGLWVLETNLDDCTGEALGFAMELLLEQGARDVWYTPAYMKKNRPAYVLSVLCTEETRELLENIIFSATTTIGIRRYPVERTALERTLRRVNTRYGEAVVKVCRERNRVRFYPEYESVRAICREQGLDFSEVFHGVTEDAQKAEQ